MLCEHCHGKGRVVTKVTFYRSGVPASQLDEIGICSFCHGAGVIHCCEGDRAQAMIAATDCNPNEGPSKLDVS